jgi:2-phosphoglycerate kinase
MTASDWSLLVIGGASSTGKSTLAQVLARRLYLHYIDADLTFLTLRKVVPADAAPMGLHVLDEDEAFWSQPPEQLVRHYFALDAFICNALEAVVAAQHMKQRRSVIEGTWLLPSFAVQSTYDGVNLAGQVRGLFLYEPDSDQLEARRRARADPRPLRFSEPVMRNLGTMRHRYGLEVKRRAEALNLPVLESRPFETLLDRSLAALDASGTASPLAGRTGRGRGSAHVVDFT